MNLKQWLTAQFPQFFPEDPETVILENKLCHFYRELRKQEDTILPRLPQDFDERLLRILSATPLDPKPNSSFAPFALWENRKVQYSLSFALAACVVFVLSSRMGQTEDPANGTAGVVLDSNSNYLSEPSSIRLTATDEKQILVDHLKAAPNAVYSLRELEVYYRNSGREQAAEELRFLIDSIER